LLVLVLVLLGATSPASYTYITLHKSNNQPPMRAIYWQLNHILKLCLLELVLLILVVGFQVQRVKHSYNK
jgi:hypothetical protein